MLEKYEDKCKINKNKADEFENALVHKQKVINEMTKEIEDLQQSRNDLEQALSEKENHIITITNNLKELEQMRDLIASISTKKRT